MCEVMQRHLFIFILTETYKVLWGIPNHPTVRVYQKIKNLSAIMKHEQLKLPNRIYHTQCNRSS